MHIFNQPITAPRAGSRAELLPVRSTRRLLPSIGTFRVTHTYRIVLNPRMAQLCANLLLRDRSGEFNRVILN